MIQSKIDLKRYIDADTKAMGFNGKSLIFEFLKGNIDDVNTMMLIRKLRKFEYVVNNFRKYGFIGNLWYIYHKNKFHRLRRKRNIYLFPNVFEEGLHIVHPGYVWADGAARIGKNCTILPRVLIGKKRPGIPSPHTYIGDNCYIGTGVTILGPVRIGNNVTIAAGAVVTSDIKDNCVVGGVPAKIINVNIINH